MTVPSPTLVGPHPVTTVDFVGKRPEPMFCCCRLADNRAFGAAGSDPWHAHVQRVGQNLGVRLAGTGSASFSIRIAVALNSAVPDLGSVASIVSKFVATSSWKCRVMNVSPGRSDGSTRIGTSIRPRREITRTRSPSVISYASASSGEMSNDSPRRSGDV
jgi:hypothetical protein